MNTPFGPALEYLRVSLAAHYARARSEESELGASAVEWVVISAIVVAIVVTVGLWLTNVLEAKGKSICRSINGAGGAGTSKCGG